MSDAADAPGGCVFHVHRADRADALVGALADVLATPPLDPFTPDVVAVHSRGIERWLAQALAARLGRDPDTAGRRDGVCANVDFPFPSRVVGRALAGLADIDLDRDPWVPARLTWPVLTAIETLAEDRRLGPLRGHLDQPGRRLGAARRIADLFDRYAVHRPAMVRAWAEERDVDASGDPLPAAHRWQPTLWREVRRVLGVPSTAERLATAADRLRSDDAPDLDLPERIALFGLTALPASSVEVLAALAARRDVHLFLLHPSPALWDAVAAALPTGTALPRRDDDPTRDAARHPLLRSWGRDVREVQVVLSRALPDLVAPPTTTAGGDQPPASLLSRLQADVRADREPPGAPIGAAPDLRPTLAGDDRSVEVHVCHGRTRQVEVLRDAILHLLADDPTLEPRDVIVMCPDIEAFAPLVEAVFGAEAVDVDGAAADDGVPALRVRLADRSIRQTNPVLRVVSEVLDLVDGRFEASRVLDLLSREPVRRRFRVDDDDLARIEEWVAALGIRWGIDAAHRAAYGLDGIDGNTWRAGLDRLLVGIAVPDDGLRLVGDTAPYGDVEGGDVDLAGRFAEFVARLAEAADRLSTPRPIAEWVDEVGAVAEMLTATTSRDAWQHQQLFRILRQVVDEARPEADAAACGVTLDLTEVRAMLGERLRGRPSRANHRTGDLTVCTLVPMRTVPHRVVCLLGMDDEAFPRRTTADGDDLIDLRPMVGDRDARTEDRQLLLDALLAATDHLVVTYTGRDERTNEPRPPAVPVGELLDAIDRTVRPSAPDTASAREQVEVHHPLQPFDQRCFEPGRLGRMGPWGFDRVDLAGARALAAPRIDRAGFLSAPLGPLDEPVVAIDGLVHFLQHPVRAFCQRRLQVRLDVDLEEPGDRMPVELTPLERFGIGDRLLDARLRGHPTDRWEAVERARGTLPPGALATASLTEARETVETMLAVAAEHGVATLPRDHLEIDVALPDGRSLVGVVPAVAGHRTVSVQYSRVGPRHELAAYVRLVALTAADPATPWEALLLGRHRSQRVANVRWCRLGPLGDDADQRRRAAADALAVLVDLYDRGLRFPLPLYTKTSADYAERVFKGDRPDRAASCWHTGNYARFPAEDRDPYHELVLGPGTSFDDLLADPPHDDEAGPGWGDEPHRLGRYARRLWEPILTCRTEGDA